MKMKKRLLSILLTLAMVVSTFTGIVPGMSMTAYAATLDNESTTWSENSDIAGNVTINNNVTVNDDITLTIPEGKILTINGQSDYSIAVINDNSHTLTVSGGGTLIVNAPEEEEGHSPIPGIYGNLIVDGATVQVTGGADGVYGNVTVKSGSVCVNGGNGKAGRNGYNGISGVVTVNGGSIIVVGGNGGNGDTDSTGDGGSGGYGVSDVIVNGGAATITGGNGGTKSNTYASNGYFGQAVYGSITGNAKESEDNINWTSVTGTASQKQYIKFEPILVTGVSLDKTTAQTIDVDGKVSFTATVTPENASDKTVKWSVGETNATAVKIYSDENCTTEVGTDATSTLTVYAKGISAGNATVTCTSNADSEKSASCDVTVNEVNTTFNPASTYTGFGDLNTNNSEVTISEVSGKTWYVIADDSSTVTLLSKQSFANKAFNSSGTGNDYANSEIKTYVDGLTGEGQPLSGISSVISDLTLIDKTTAKGLSEIKRRGAGENWWLRSPANYSDYAAFVEGGSGNVYDNGLSVTDTVGVRPALKLDLTKVTFDFATNTFALLPTPYSLWVGGVQVTSANKDDVLGDGKVSYTPAVTGDNPIPATLTLNGATITGGNADTEYSAIYAKDMDLTINVTADSTVNGPDHSELYASSYGINMEKYESGGVLTVKGDGKLTVIGGVPSNENGGGSYGVCGSVIVSENAALIAKGNAASEYGGSYGVNGSVTVNGALTATGGRTINGNSVGVYTYNSSVTVNGALTATGGRTTNGDSIGVYAYNSSVTVNGALTATGDTVGEDRNSCGVDMNNSAGSGTCKFTINENAEMVATGGAVANSYGVKQLGVIVTVNGNTKVTASGNAQAFNGTVKNAITGTGWTNTAGTEGQAAIADSTTGQLLNSYKKVQFPAAPGKISVSAMQNGSVKAMIGEDEVTEAKENDTVTLAVAPAEGYRLNELKATYQKNSIDSLADMAALIGDAVFTVEGSTTRTCQVQDGNFVFLDGDTVLASTAGVTSFTGPDTDNNYKAGTVDDAVYWTFRVNDGKIKNVYYYNHYNNGGMWDSESGTGRLASAGTSNGIITALLPLTTVTEGKTYTFTMPASDVEVSATFEQKANAVTATVTANNRTYDGTEKPLVTVTGEPTGGTMQYALGTATEATEQYTTSIPAKTDAGTYYVWYKAVGTDGHADSAVACVTVTISEPSSGGGGGGYTIEPTTETAPSTPTETYTIPVENESTVNVQVDIQNGNAKVTEITEEDIHKVTEESSGEDSQGKTSENNTILIDLSGSTQEVKSVELSKTTMERLAETATSTENKIETVTVQLTNVTVELDAKTLSAVTQQAEGNSINLVVEDTNASTLNSDQQQALSEFTSASTFEAYFESAGSRIHDFRGGEATVSMKFTPAQGLSITHYHVYYVATSGKLERFVTRFIKTLIKAEKSDKKGASEGEGILQFTTTHFSDYAIVYDETMENATGQEEADDTSSGEDKTKTANGKSSYENGLSINKGLKVSQKGETIQISWGKVKGADGYDVYVQYCGKAFSSKPAMGVNREVTSVTIKKINGKKLNLKKNYKIFVVAYKNVAGKKKRLAKSIVAHIVGAKNTRYSNPKELTITSDTDVTLEKGKTSKIKARVILANAKRKSLSDAHAPMFRYASSDKKIATVDKKGKITAKKQGSCLIWVYAKNGYAKKVKVTVK